jgi:NAD(P)-dependent dehydrogenase (short-subunit alcohol dehydrogenase family)
MRTKRKTMIVTGAAKEIGAGVTNAFIERGYNVVANSLDITASTFASTQRAGRDTRRRRRPSDGARDRFDGNEDLWLDRWCHQYCGLLRLETIYGVHRTDFKKLAGTNLRSYIYITQLAVKQMLTQNGGGSVTCATSAMAEHPIAGIHAWLPMVTKGGLEAITRNLAMEYVNDGIRLNAVAQGVVDAPRARIRLSTRSSI